MVVLIIAAWLARVQTKRAKHWAMFLETVIVSVQDQIEQISPGQSHRYLPFIATLFLFILTSALVSVVPGFRAPTASLSTTAALAIAVLVAVPAFAISANGLIAYLRQYTEPTPFMLPFNIIGELSRTIALAVRLYGNMMSGAVLAAILVSIAPFFFPVLMQGIGLLTGIIQAYIFAVLATVYIASAGAQSTPNPEPKEAPHG
jgi:F-type H+-transporting ATPase subunit a